MEIMESIGKIPPHPTRIFLANQVKNPLGIRAFSATLAVSIGEVPFEHLDPVVYR
jgi:hypothetical protein